MEEIKITAVVGSLRKESLNRKLAELAASITGPEAGLKILEYSDLPIFNQDNEFPAPGPVTRIREIIKSSDGIWFFSPEYNHSYPGALKNIIDWLSRPAGKNERHVLYDKPAAISGITPGMSGTGIAQDHLVTLISYLNMKVMNTPRTTVPNASQYYDGDNIPDLTPVLKYLKAQSDAFIEFINKNRCMVESCRGNIAGEKAK